MPSMKLTDPVGVPEPGATAATVAVNVMLCPVTAGLADEVSTVSSWMNLWRPTASTAADVLALKLASAL